MAYFTRADILSQKEGHPGQLYINTIAFLKILGPSDE